MSTKTSGADTTQKSEWSTPFYGVSHLGKPGDKRWATVSDRGSFTETQLWFAGCGFYPHEETFESMEEARSAGEAWVERAELKRPSKGPWRYT